MSSPRDRPQHGLVGAAAVPKRGATGVARRCTPLGSSCPLGPEANADLPERRSACSERQVMAARAATFGGARCNQEPHCATARGTARS